MGSHRSSENVGKLKVNKIMKLTSIEFIYFLITFQDKKSLRNLKFQLAEDGAPEVQYDLGKQLLDDMEGIIYC